MLKPYQKPHPPLAVSAMSPNSNTARVAGERGWGLVSANFMPVDHALTHWAQCCSGAEQAGRRPDRSLWRIARSVLITDSDEEARDYLSDPQSSYGWCYSYLREHLANYDLLKIFKPRDNVPDNDVTYPKYVEWMVMHGRPSAVLDQLMAMVDKVGSFGTLSLTHKDWDRPELHRRSMRLFGERVMPKLSSHMSSLKAAE